MAIEPVPMWTPEGGQPITVTYVGDGRTVGLVVVPETFERTAKNYLKLTGPLRHAGFLGGIDRRLDNQRKSIDQLLNHLQKHCPHLLDPTRGCEHLGH